MPDPAGPNSGPDPLARISTTRKPSPHVLGVACVPHLETPGKPGAPGGTRRSMTAALQHPAADAARARPVEKAAEITRQAAILTNRKAKVSDRAVSMVILAKLGITPESEAALTRVLLEHDDDDRLRVLAAITLGTAHPPLPGASRTFYKTMLDRESATVHLGEANGGGTLRSMSAELLIDLPGGRAMLEGLALRPMGPDYFPWMLAVKVAHGGDSDTFLPLVSEIATDSKRPVELRVAAIIALGATISDWDQGIARRGWDTIVSLSLARSENGRVRLAAAEILKLRQGPP